MYMIHTLDYPRKTMKNMWWLYVYTAIFGVMMFALVSAIEPEYATKVWFLSSLAGRIVFAAMWASYAFALAYYAMREKNYYLASIPIDGSARVLFFIYAWLFWIPLAVSRWRMKRTIELNEQADEEAERQLELDLEQQLTKDQEVRFPPDGLRVLMDYCIDEAKVIEKDLPRDELCARCARITACPMVVWMGLTEGGDPFFSIRAFYVPDWARAFSQLDNDWTQEDDDRIWLAVKYDLGDYILVFQEHHRLQLKQVRSGMLANERKADQLGSRLEKYVEEHYAGTLQPWLYAGKIDEVVLKVVELLNDGHCVDQMQQERHFVISQHYHVVPRPINAIVKRQLARAAESNQPINDAPADPV